MSVLALALVAAVAVGSDEPRPDCFGDPLPDGAVSRLGSVRLRHDPGDRIAAAVLSADHAVLVVAAGPAVYVWRTSDGERLRTIDGPGGRVTAIALHPNGKTLACASDEGTLALFDLRTGKEVRRLAEGRRGGFGALAYSPDGKRLASGSRDLVQLWGADGKEVRRWEEPTGRVHALSFSRDGARLAFGGPGGPEGVGGVVDAESGAVLSTTEAGQVVLSLDGETAALADRAAAAVLRDAKTGERLTAFPSARPAGPGPRAFSPDGRTLVTSDGLWISTFWDLKSGKKRAEAYGRAFGFAADGRLLALATADGFVRLCDGATGADLHPEFGHAERPAGAAFSPGGDRLATAGPDGMVCLWDARTGKLVRRVADGAPPSPRPESVRFAANGKALVAYDDRPRRWDAATGKQQDESPGRAAEGGRVLAASADGRRTLRIGPGDSVRLWNEGAGKEVSELLPAEEGAWRAAAFSPDGSLAAVVSGRVIDAAGAKPGEKAPARVAVWEADGGRPVCSFTTALEARGFAPEIRLGAGGTLALAAEQGIRLWDAASAQDLGEIALPPAARLRGLALSPDGQLLAAGDGDGFRLWDTATRREVRRWKADGASVLAFAPDGGALLTAEGDGTCLLWDVAGRLEPRDGPPTPKLLEALWDDLAGDAAEKAWRAVRTLAAAPEPSLRLLNERLKPTVVRDPRGMARLIADLDADDFATREKASAELTKRGDEAVPALRAALAAKPSPEALRRITAILSARRAAPPAEELRARRAVCALEWMGTAGAKDLLAALANGAAGAPATDAARAALDRLEKRDAAAP
jgi:WD40 repeat protein